MEALRGLSPSAFGALHGDHNSSVKTNMEKLMAFEWGSRMNSCSDICPSSLDCLPTPSPPPQSFHPRLHHMIPFGGARISEKKHPLQHDGR